MHTDVSQLIVFIFNSSVDWWKLETAYSSSHNSFLLKWSVCFVQVLLQCPRLLSYSIEHKIWPAVHFLQSIGLTKEDIKRLLVAYPSVLGYNIENRLRPHVEFLQSIGIQDNELCKVVTLHPSLMGRKVDKCFKPVVEHLHSIGLTHQQVTTIVSRHPPVLIKSIQNSLQPKIDFLVNVMGRSLHEVVEYPAFFGSNLRKKIEPRYRRLGDQAQSCTLMTMLDCSGSKFNQRFGSCQVW